MKLKNILPLVLLLSITGCRTTGITSSISEESTNSTTADSSSSSSSEPEISLPEIEFRKAENIQYPYAYKSEGRVCKSFPFYMYFVNFYWGNFRETNQEAFYYLQYDSKEVKLDFLGNPPDNSDDFVNPEYSMEYDKGCDCGDEDCICKGEKYEHPIVKISQCLFLIKYLDYSEEGFPDGGYIFGIEFTAYIYPTDYFNDSELQFCLDTEAENGKQKMFVLGPQNQLISVIEFMHDQHLTIDAATYLANYFLTYLEYFKKNNPLP